jgi:hypothetical protein
MAAEVSFEEGITERRVTGETIRATLSRLGVRWERAKRWMESPDPEYERKKGIEIGWSGSPRPIVDGFWASRRRELVFSLREALFCAFLGAGGPAEVRLLLQKEARKDDPEPKALSC